MQVSEPPPEEAPKPRHFLLGVLGVLGLCLMGGLSSFFLQSAFPNATLWAWRERRPPPVPPALRAYHDRAVLGDASAMRMLGTMYYNGLNVPRDTSEGIRWYRKAAISGSVAARRDLEQLGLSVTGK